MTASGESSLIAVAVIAAALCVAALVGSAGALRRLRIARGALGLLAGLLLAAIGSLAATVSAGLSGYRALAREEVAAIVSIAPLGDQRFEARIVDPSGGQRRFELAGDQIQVDARILKWHPFVSQLGLHTAYQLDRVSGRYTRIDDEQSRPRTVFSLAEDRAVDLFDWSRRLGWVRPLLDAEYGSATFTGALEARSYEVRVSISGLLIRPVERDGPEARAADSRAEGS